LQFFLWLLPTGSLARDLEDGDFMGTRHRVRQLVNKVIDLSNALISNINAGFERGIFSTSVLHVRGHPRIGILDANQASGTIAVASETYE